MINVIMLDAVKNEKTAKMLAHKILANRSDVSFSRMLEMLAEGDVEYLVWQDGEKKEVFYEAIGELKKFEVKYQIIKFDSPTPEEKDEPEVEAQPALSEQEEEEEEPIFVEEEPTLTKHKIVHVPQSEHKEHASNGYMSLFEDEPKKKKPFAFPFRLPSFAFHEKYPAIFNAVVLITVLVVFILIMFKFPESRNRQSGFSHNARSSRQAPQNQTGQHHQQGSGGAGAGNRQTTESRQRAQATQVAKFNEALDNASQGCGTRGVFNIEKTYRFAISFNRQNVRAWLGLLNCFENANDAQKTNEIRSEMREIFGEDVFAIIRLSELFGTLEDLTIRGNNCKITYTRKNRQAQPARELFLITSSIANITPCRRLTVFARESITSGRTISVELSKFPRTFEEFEKTVTVNKVGF